ncbi:MAG TPA: MmcQ/YjbR family DNA-binding protein [Pseudonocardiaceae bacterium]|nr:MmcQ/YjbR family DNA-binding protein [Pseudonocardiaceae bacterium]
MTLDDVIAYCMAKPGAEEAYPWGDGELVCKVGGKAFAFIGLGTPKVGLKCGPTAEAGDEWRDRYPAITASTHIGRYGWISVPLDGTVPAGEVRELLDMSYDAVVARLPKARRPGSTAERRGR